MGRITAADLHRSHNLQNSPGPTNLTVIHNFNYFRQYQGSILALLSNCLDITLVPDSQVLISSLTALFLSVAVTCRATQPTPPSFLKRPIISCPTTFDVELDKTFTNNNYPYNHNHVRSKFLGRRPCCAGREPLAAGAANELEQQSSARRQLPTGRQFFSARSTVLPARTELSAIRGWI